MKGRAGQAGKEGEAWLGGEERTVAFVDIIGFSNEVKKMARRPADFRKVVTALLGVSSAAEPNAGERDLLAILARQEGGEEYTVDLQTVFFSDSAFVSARNVGTDRVLRVVLGFARHLLLHGFFVRGGIARGPAAHRKGTVVGPAVLAAYDLESRAAIYPRIVVEDAVAKDLLRIADKPNAATTIRRGEDGLYFVDVLTTLGLRPDGGRILRQARKLIVKRLDERRPLDLNAKWRWMAAQYNRTARLVRSSVRGKLEPIDRPEVPEFPDLA